MIRKIAAAVTGIIVAGGIVFAVESLVHTVYPLPADLDMNDPVQRLTA